LLKLASHGSNIAAALQQAHNVLQAERTPLYLLLHYPVSFRKSKNAFRRFVVLNKQ
jgi:hypothetical protein